MWLAIGILGLLLCLIVFCWSLFALESQTKRQIDDQYTIRRGIADQYIAGVESRIAACEEEARDNDLHI